MDKRIPMRTCIGCNEIKPKKELLRIVRPKDSPVTVDPACRTDGRGAYMCADLSCFEKAVKRRAFSRTFREAVSDEVLSRLRSEFVEAIKDKETV